ncbi:hypothetical protein ACN5PC_03955 [Aliarcobacter butzleri]|uniref:hypothetical protein n=1 Tax=Aliarcobacter butzleri TaxID=28197 RepID=UPI001260DD53|nr:hypothetical protein [Aliarcobacter butzleri]MCG3653329.1 hypothetical protein [Aliarcobacter butzleri]MCT7547286.1 hypothetical protein [Aliarcobacter butzleri]MDN5129990.1 hypothetical protein [Aliarcobacter butzleri]
MITADKIALASFFISLGSLAFTIINNSKVKKLENDKFDYLKKSEKENTLQFFKKEIREYRITLNDIFKSKKVISYHEKDIYSMNSDLNIHKIKDCLSNNIYKDFQDLEILIDESLNAVIYQKNFDKIPLSIQNMQYFLKKLDNIAL